MNSIPTPTKFFLYIRKSTDEEDRQVLSLEAQLTELKEFAEKEGVEIIETLVEKKTAKVPGRPVFTSMMDRIEGGLPHPIGILACLYCTKLAPISKIADVPRAERVVV